MIRDISFQYPQWYILLCLALGLIYASFLYYRDKKFKEQNVYLPYIMGALRCLVASLIALLLLTPLIKTTTEETKQPLVIIAQDNSQSIGSNWSEEDKAAHLDEMNRLGEELNSQYEVRKISFGDGVETGLVDSFKNEVSNLSESIEYIYDNYGDQNLGAVIFSTDGIFNEGKNPLYTNSRLKAPFYSIALGDTSVRKDLILKNVFNNKIAYLGDKFTIQTDILAKNCVGGQTTLSVSKVTNTGTTKLEDIPISINSNNFFVTKEIILDASESGVVRYRLSLSGLGNEQTYANNTRDIFLEILDARQKILILANAPHPDLSAFRQIITSNKNYELEVGYIDDYDQQLADYNLVIFHNLPSYKHKIKAELERLNTRKTPRLFIFGSQASFIELNQVQSNISMKGSLFNVDEIQATIDESFSSYIIDERLKRELSNFPPLIAPFGEYTAGPATNILLKQKIKKVDTDYPLLSYTETDGYKTGVLSGEGLWRWRLYDFVKNDNYDIVTELVNKMVQYLSVKEDKRKFRVFSNKNIYKENESIYLSAQLYNDNYELVNEADVFVKIIDDDNKEFNYTLSRANGYYVLDAGLFSPGNYRFTATTNYNGRSLSQSGKFSVQSIQLELYDLTARHDILQGLSSKNGGKVFYPNEIDSLSNELLDNVALKSVIYQNTKTKSIINFKLLFFLFLALLAMEWFLRRYYGHY